MILDTNAVSALSFEEKHLIELLAASPRHHLPAVVIGEYQFGLIGSKRKRELDKWLELLISESIVLPIEHETARGYAVLRNELRNAGLPIPANDLWIAALAWQHRLPVISRDAHFDKIPGIRRLSW